MSGPFSDACSHKVARQVFRRHYTLLASTGARAMYCLGCGANGCAFRAPEWTVLKVSANPDEAPLARVLAHKGRAWPFLPVFHGGWVLPGTDFGQRFPIGVTWREDLVDFEPASRERGNYIAAATDLVKALKQARDPEDARREHESFLVRWAPANFSHTSLAALRAIAGLAEWSLEFGLGFRLDEFSGLLAIRNLGQSLEADDAIVVRDLGYWNDSRRGLERLELATEGMAVT